MVYFFENVMDDALLIRLGMNEDADRVQILECFEYSFKFFSKERVTVFSEFLGLVVKCVDGLNESKTLSHETGLRNGELNEHLLLNQTEISNLKDKVSSVETISVELSVVNSKQSDGIVAFKARVDSLKLRLLIANSSITSLQNEISDANVRASIPCVSCSGLCAEIAELKNRLESVQKSRSGPQHGVLFFRKQAAGYRLNMLKTKRDWEKWSKHGASMNPRCGCSDSIRFFERSGIDLAWVTEEATRASAGYERELKDVVDDLKARVAVIRAECDEKVQAAYKERDDAVSDNTVYIDQMLLAKKEQTISRGNMCSSINELSSIRAEFAKRQSFELSIRAYMFRGVDGEEKCCPVPTVDGVLVSLIDVYTGWLDGVGGGGLETQFKCPITG
jgi:hypothetical protein